jgi:C-terminal processing protease CtpA/Prc
MTKKYLWVVLAGALCAASADAQRVVVPQRTLSLRSPDGNAPRIGVYLGESSLRDTLGVLVSSVVEDGPAANAGLREGDRIQAVGGVNLRMNRDDAEDPTLSGMMIRRLTRELDKLKPGDEVELRVMSGGTARTVRVKTVAARELAERTVEHAIPMSRVAERASLGVTIGGSLSKRDTLGVFVTSVIPDGPAERAGIVEGDRIARINGVDLRVPREDAGDADLARARARRFSQEVAKLGAGESVTLEVVTGGRQREVRVNAVKQSELQSDNTWFHFGDGVMSFPHIEFPRFRALENGDHQVIEEAVRRSRSKVEARKSQLERVKR